MASKPQPEAEAPPPRRTILAPLPDEAPISTAARGVPAPSSSAAAPRQPDPGAATPPRTSSVRRGSSSREEKPDSSTKSYLWRRNVRFIDTLVMNMEDHGARAGDINRSVVLRAAITALERAGLARELARCTNEEELTSLILARLGQS